MSDRGARRAAVPERSYYRIGEASVLVGEPAHVLRYWQSELRVPRGSKSATGQRVFSKRDVETLLRIRALLRDEGYTLEGVRKKLRAAPGEPEPQEITPTPPTAQVALAGQVAHAEHVPPVQVMQVTQMTQLTGPEAPQHEGPGATRRESALHAELCEIRGEIERFLARLESGR